MNASLNFAPWAPHSGLATSACYTLSALFNHCDVPNKTHLTTLQGQVWGLKQNKTQSSWLQSLFSFQPPPHIAEWRRWPWEGSPFQLLPYLPTYLPGPIPTS